LISNYYILNSVVHEIQERFTSARFLRAYSIHPGELRIEFDRGEIVASLQPAHTSLYIFDGNQQQAKRNVISFFKELQGHELASIAIKETDKLVTLGFGEYDLVLRFYDSPNALLLSNNELISSFKKEKANRPEKDDIKDVSSLFGKWLRAECETEHISSEAFDKKLRASHESILYKRASGLLLSPIILKSLTDEYEIFKSPSEAIEYVLRTRNRHSILKAKKDSWLSKLKAALARTEKALSDAQSGIENSAREQKYSLMGDLLQSHAHEIQKGMDSITEGDLHIPLDPALNAFENAKRYYDKARRAKENRNELRNKFTVLTREKEKLLAFIENVTAAAELAALDSIEKEISRSGFSLHQTSDDLTESGPLAKFRQYTVAGGFRVLVGKNAKQNDELTMKVAKKEDLWFHARHVPGSHVILQTNNAKQIPKEAIEQAAEIAAFFSDAKTQKHAPVAYTKRKFVRKPKGSAPGAVLIEKEEVVIVTPKVPNDS
jgi:predicted ribosome quality control (RQC) complex YloA/Tae2 family protein